MVRITTIQISQETKTRLEVMKEHARETYEELIKKLMELAEEEKLELSTQTKKGIAKARQDIKKGKVYTTKELIRELGI